MTANDSNMQERKLSWECGPTTTCNEEFNSVALRRYSQAADAGHWAGWGAMTENGAPQFRQCRVRRQITNELSAQMNCSSAFSQRSLRLYGVDFSP